MAPAHIRVKSLIVICSRHHVKPIPYHIITGGTHPVAQTRVRQQFVDPGRRDAAELTLFRSLGLAVEDLAAAECAVAAATSGGLGTEVEL
jgi:ornithine cyclodeaminase